MTRVIDETSTRSVEVVHDETIGGTEGNPHALSGRAESVGNRNMIPDGETGVFYIENEDKTVFVTD